MQCFMIGSSGAPDTAQPLISRHVDATGLARSSRCPFTKLFRPLVARRVSSDPTQIESTVWAGGQRVGLPNPVAARAYGGEIFGRGRGRGGVKRWRILHGKDAEILVDAQRLNFSAKFIERARGGDCQHVRASPKIRIFPTRNRHEEAIYFISLRRS
ncbi:hypothetical protein NL676_032670 [Syzygium grande]|nr:hypothetical protein NL676_032670 [Syzygium grande]